MSVRDKKPGERPEPQATSRGYGAPACAEIPFKARGFTLIEMLVALSVFSLAALALLKLQGFTLATTADLDQKLLGQIVARNLAVELLSDPAPPGLGQTSGDVENGGQLWHWTRKAKLTDDPRIIQIDLRVEGHAGTSPNALTIVRMAK
ncbi:type II secretion system minor pseudopilin GspI [Rhizorhapis suberifaciens]|uniref:Type II secretion system protein I n=1 Tax=Rhizorhapis suberifaciens TaxID=13656 RepID=A0A840HSX6_9SPHN|nr:type II secretion system minor pseudopilin GspI [Rhizorhapis suberifaciens]MBB4641033.1 general secretion pathway protein I [Rhizorhapis suberifaciens]